MSLFLSDEDMEILTGRKHKNAQIKALIKMGIPFCINAAGKPIVTIEAMNGKIAAIIPKRHTGWKSNKAG